VPVLPLPERASVRDARLELTTPLGALSVPFIGELRPEQERTTFLVDIDGARLAAPTGQLLGTLRVEGHVPLGLRQIALDPRAIAGNVSASGRLDLRAQRLAVPALADGVGGAGQLEFVLEGGRLEATLSEAGLQIARVAPARKAVLELLPAPWQLELTEPARILASFADGVRVDGGGEIALTTAGPELQLALSTTATWSADRHIRELEVSAAQLDLRDLRVAGMRLERGSIQLEGSGTPQAWQGSLALDLTGAGALPAGLALEGAAARADLDLRFSDGQLSAFVDDPGMVQAAALSWAGNVRVEGLQLHIAPSSAPLLSVELAGGDVAWQQRLSATLPEFRITAAAGGTPFLVRAQAEGVQLELTGDREGLKAGRAILSGGAASLPAHRIRATGIAAEIGFSAGGLLADAPIPISIATLAHEGNPPWFAPLRLDGSLRPQGDRIAFDLALGRAAGGVEMRVRGEHDLAPAEGRAEIDLPAVEFAPGLLQPVQLAPVLADVIRDVSGRAALDGTLRWGARTNLRADLGLLVEDLAFRSGPARFAQVNGVITLDHLAPPSTPPGQQLAFGLVDMGLPLTDGLVTFDLEPGELLVEQLRWRFAEGRIRAAPFTIGSGEIRFSTTLTAERLKLDEIFALAQLEGLTGEGTMHGTLPITVAGAEAVIHNGELVSDRPGWVRYRPGHPPAALQAGGENVNLLLQALQNFRYKELRVSIDGRTDGDMDVRLHIAGANPDLYDGHPIEFNLNLEGALADVVRAGLAGYRIPERIREQMQGFGR
jgi:hypothetical protein